MILKGLLKMLLKLIVKGINAFRTLYAYAHSLNKIQEKHQGSAICYSFSQN